MLAEHPNEPEALAILGAVIGFHEGETEQGIRLIEQACSLQPGMAHWRSNLAGLYRKQGRLAEALRMAQDAVALSPAQAVYHLNLARIQLDLDDEEAAQAAVFEALARDRDHVESHLVLGEMLLRRGEMRAGWRELEWLDRTNTWFRALPKMTIPKWSGMRLARGRLLVIADQGFGDVIQYSRFIPAAADLCHEVIVICDPALVGLLARVRGVTTCVSQWEALPPLTAWTRLSRLPWLFGTDQHTIPAPDGHVTADPVRVDAWRKRISGWANRKALRIGLAWAGNPKHANDHRRSIPLAALAPLLATPEACFVALQRMIPERDQAFMDTASNLLDISADLTDFGETAAAIARLDLIITVDSAVAHLAGALGKEAWVLLPEPSDWRWMRRRTDTPWYPSLRLFRQPASGEWLPVIRAVTGELKRQADAPRPHPTALPSIGFQPYGGPVRQGHVAFVGVEFDRTGAAMSILRYAVHLRSRGYGVDILSRPNEAGPLQDVFARAGMRILKTPAEIPPGTPVIGNTIFSHSVLDHLVGKYPTLWWIHEGHAGLKYLDRTASAVALLSKVGALVFQHPGQRRLYDAHLTEVDPWLVHFAPPPVDPCSDRGIRSRSAGPVQIVSIGSVYPRKRHADLIVAIDKLVDLDVYCTIVGKIHGLDEAAHAIVGARSDRFSLIGDRPHDETMETLARADIYCHPSADESCPMSVLEAAARSIPVIVANLPVYEGLWEHGRNCLMYPAGDVKALADAITVLSTDNTLYERLATAGLRRSKIFQPQFFTARVDAALASLD